MTAKNPQKAELARKIENASQPCKRDRTRTLLIEAAIDILSTKGMEGTSIDELTQAAGMARGTFYNHFEHRDELLNAVSNYIRETLYQRVVDYIPASYSAEQTFTCITFGFIHYGLKHPKTGWALVRIGGSAHWVSGERFSRTHDVLQTIMANKERPYLGLVYIEGVALMVLRRLLENVITIQEAESIIALAMRGIGIDNEKIASLVSIANEFVKEHELCS